MANKVCSGQLGFYAIYKLFPRLGTLRFGGIRRNKGLRPPNYGGLCSSKPLFGLLHNWFSIGRTLNIMW